MIEHEENQDTVTDTWPFYYRGWRYWLEGFYRWLGKRLPPYLAQCASHQLLEYAEQQNMDVKYIAAFCEMQSLFMDKAKIGGK